MYGYVWLLVTFAVGIHSLESGPKWPATNGEIWPAPQREYKTKNYYSFDPGTFKFQVTSHTCDIIKNALKRIVRMQNSMFEIVKRLQEAKSSKKQEGNMVNQNNDPFYQGFVKSLDIELTAPCEQYPSLEMKESYTLSVSDVSKLESNTVWGILRGLESFSQLFYITKDFTSMRLYETMIVDYPEYPHRGLLLDTSRHFISVKSILTILNAMAMNKMNVFHWHIVDDPSFPYQSEKFPELSERGAYHPLLVYSRTEIQNIIETAKDLGIRVIPEFDIPGHTQSWGAAYPNILTECYKGKLGPMNPLNNDTYKLLGDLFKDVRRLFPEKYLHLGGDEVDMSCWASNPELKKYMREHGINTNQLLGLFMERVQPLVEDANSTPIVWQEIFDQGVTLPNSTIVQVWKHSSMTHLLKTGKKVLYSSAYYLDHLSTGGDWRKYYNVDPRSLVASELKHNVLGGEACMWTEVVDDNNVISRIWPRASAVAERLWSGMDQAITIDWSRASRRLEEHTCRMLRAGVAAQPPNDAGFCIYFKT